MSDERTRESQLVGSASMAVTDFVRILDNDASRKILLSRLLDDSKPYLESIGFITNATVGGGVANRLNVTEFTADHLILLTEAVILADLTAGTNLDFTLPAMSQAYDTINNVGQQFSIKISRPNSTTSVTVKTQGSDLIDLAADVTLTGPSDVFITLVPDGTDWWSIGG